MAQNTSGFESPIERSGPGPKKSTSVCVFYIQTLQTACCTPLCNTAHLCLPCPTSGAAEIRCDYRGLRDPFGCPCRIYPKIYRTTGNAWGTYKLCCRIPNFGTTHDDNASSNKEYEQPHPNLRGHVCTSNAVACGPCHAGASSCARPQAAQIRKFCFSSIITISQAVPSAGTTYL